MLSYYSFEQELIRLLPDYQKKKTLLAISGGVDSMVLAHVFNLLPFSEKDYVQIAHINYHFRGEDSNLDQKLVEDFCKKHAIKLHIYSVSEEEKKDMTSLQNWARELRYRFFREIQQQEDLDFIVTAHHLDDELETFIINLSRASGLAGLSGIPENDNQIIRPLLSFSKEEIYDFAKKENIPFREDKTNQKTDYLRNRIRHEVAPKLKEINVDFEKNFRKSLVYLKQSKNFIDQQIDQVLNEIQIKSNDFLVLNKSQFLKLDTFVRFEILKKFGFHHQAETEKIGKAKTGSIFLSEEYHLLVNRNELIFKSLIYHSEEQERIDLKIENNCIYLTSHHTEILHGSWKLDAQKIKLPLHLRKKKEGDYFYPSGMMGKKLVSKYFKDEKLSTFAKQKIWLLCDADENILGVLPFRQDRRFIAEEGNFITIYF